MRQFIISKLKTLIIEVKSLTRKKTVKL